jgi:hypothetical protein
VNIFILKYVIIVTLKSMIVFQKRNKIAVVNDNDIHIDDICSICLENLIVNQSNIIATNCKHYYHKKCIIEWLKIKDICPICNTKNISIYDY